MSKDIMDFLIKVRLVKSLIVIREEETTIQRKKNLVYYVILTAHHSARSILLRMEFSVSLCFGFLVWTVDL